MKLVGLARVVVALVVGVNVLPAQEAVPQMPAPQKEHQWLGQLVGEWETKGEAVMGPGQPPLKCEGTEKVRDLGGFWTVSELNSTIMGQTMTGVMTLGYDAKKKKYVGTWVDSMTDHMWNYEGTLDPTGKVLTLEAEGPNMMEAGKMSRYRDVIEIKNKDHKVLTSSMQTEDGEWVQFMTMDYRRKK